MTQGSLLSASSPPAWTPTDNPAYQNIGFGSDTATFNTDPQNVTLTVPTAGYAIVAAQGSNAVAWTNATEEYEVVGANRHFALAYNHTAGSQSIDMTGSPFDGASVAAAAWGA